MDLIAKGIRSIFLWITIFIYELITNLYNIFERLCKARILDSEVINALAQRIGMLLGLIMLFIVSFSVIQIILEPEKLTDKEKGIGNIAKKIILVIVMLGTSTATFNALYGVQSIIIDSHIISKFLLPNYDVNIEKFGGVLSSELFISFFKPYEQYESKYNRAMIELKRDIINYNDFSSATEMVNEGLGSFALWTWGAFEIDFNWLLSPLLGLGALYFLFTYCITVGTRTLQLAFLEIISPMAIISYLSPKKETMFEKWWKVYFATYIDVFIRIIIINLAVFLIAVLLSDDSISLTFWNSVGGENSSGAFWIKIFMILAILTFAKKAPDLLKDLFPAGASKLGLGITSPKQLFSNMLGGDLLNKGYDKVRGAAKGIGLLPLNGAKRVITGIDSAVHGKGFVNGFWKNPSKFGQWVNKQRETFTPEGYKVYKEKKEGKEYAKSVSNSWQRGVTLAKKLMSNGFGAINEPGKTEFLKAFDGKTIKTYEDAFINQEFARAKFRADQASNHQEDIQNAITAFKMDEKLLTFTIRDKDGSTKIINRSDNLEDMLRSATKAKDSTSKHLDEVSKIAVDDAKALEGFKILKGNDTDPMNASKNYKSEGLEK